MDVLTTVAIASTVLSAILFLLYKIWNKDEDTFAKAMKENKITLLEDVAAPKKKDDKKEKEKQQKKKEEQKKKKAAASAESKDDKPVAPAAPAKEESPKPAAPVPKKETAAKKEQPKPEEPKKKEVPAKAAPAPEPVVKKETVPVQAAAPAPEQKKSAQSNGDKKANKKTTPNKQAEEIENEEEFVEAKTKKNKKTEKKEAAPAPTAETTAPKHLSLKDLDINKVVARLSAIDEIEVEYIDYLNKFFHDTAATSAKVAVDEARAKRAAEESARALAAAKNEKTKLEGELENTRRLTHELANKAAVAASAEAELKSKLAAVGPEMEKLHREAESSKKAAAAAAAAAAAVVIPVVPDNKEELEKAKAAEKSLQSRVADLEDQLKNTKENAAKDRKQLEQSVLQQKSREDAAVGQEVLLAESRQNAKAISQRLTELEKLKQELEQRVADANKQTEELREEAKQRETAHAGEITGFKKMIEDLTKEVQNFDAMKKEQSDMITKLAAKEAELAKKQAALEEAEKQITVIKQGSETSSTAAETQIAKLTQRIAELEQALAEEQKRAAEVVIPVAEEPKKVEVVEEVVELKKSAYLNAAPPTADQSEEIETLKKENARLQEKNDSLRSEKHQLVDQLNLVEKRLMANGSAGPAPSTSTEKKEKEGGKKKGKGGDKKESKGAEKEKEEEEKKEEERVRTERRLVVTHVGKLYSGPLPALDDAADTKSYEKWLLTVAASIKEAGEKAKKSLKEKTAAPATKAADDDEKTQLREQNEHLRYALDNVLMELHLIEQLKSAPAKNTKAQIAEVRSAIDALPALTVPAATATASAPVASTARGAAARHSPPTSQSEDDGSWEVVA